MDIRFIDINKWNSPGSETCRNQSRESGEVPEGFSRRLRSLSNDTLGLFAALRDNAEDQLEGIGQYC